jgi:hypothetical protein
MTGRRRVWGQGGQQGNRKFNAAVEFFERGGGWGAWGLGVTSTETPRNQTQRKSLGSDRSSLII